MKKFFSILAVLLMTVSMSAQQTTIEGSKLFDNTTISLYGGATSWINSGVVNEETFWQGVRPVTGVAVGKWFTPVVGAELFYEGGIGNFPFSADADRWTFYDFANLGLNAMFNVNNMFGYKGYAQRVEVVPFAGIGWGHGFTTLPGCNLTSGAYNEGDHTSNFVTADAGARVDFNMGKQRAWQINFRPAITWLMAGEGLDVQLNSDHAYLTAQIGVTYRFGHKNSTGKRVHNFTSAYTVAQYNALEAELAALQAKYNEKPKEVEKVVEKEVVKEVTNEVVKVERANTVPHFVQGRAIVDATSISVLDALAQELKNTDDTYTLTGYASEEGDEAFNQSLSLKRAQAIKQCLVDRGVAAERLTAVGGGETSKFGETHEANRIVTIEKD